MEVQSITELLKRRYADNLEPSSVQSAETDVQELSNFDDRIQRAKHMLQNAWQWLTQHEDLPADIRQKALHDLEAEKSRIELEEKRLKDLEAKLNEELIKKQELASQYNQVEDQLSALTTEIAQSHQIEDPQQKNARFEQIRQQTLPLLERVQLLERQPGFSSIIEPETLKLQVNNLQNSTNKAIEFAAIENQVNSNAAQIEGKVNEIEELLSRPSPTIDDLKVSKDMMAEIRPKIEEIARNYADLSNDDNVPIDLRNKMAEKLSKLNLLFEVSTIFRILI